MKKILPKSQRRNLSHNLLQMMFPIAQKLISHHFPEGVGNEVARRGFKATLGKSDFADGDFIGPEMRVALVIGHNVARQGAVCVGDLPITEFLFNSAVAQGMAFHAWQGLQVQTFFRKAGLPFANEIAECYQRVNSWQPDLTIEMHFNAANGSADYSLVLYKLNPNDRTAETMANHFANAFSNLLGTSHGYARAFQTKRDRGATSAYHCRSPFLLAEPFFGDHAATMERISSPSGIQLVISAYLEGIRRVGIGYGPTATEAEMAPEKI